MEVSNSFVHKFIHKYREIQIYRGKLCDTLTIVFQMFRYMQETKGNYPENPALSAKQGCSLAQRAGLFLVSDRREHCSRKA